MKFIKHYANKGNVIKDLLSGKIYCQIWKIDAGSELLSNIDELELDLAKEVYATEILHDKFFSVGIDNTKIYSFAKNNMTLLKEITLDNLRFNNNYSRFYSLFYINNEPYIRCFDSLRLLELFAFKRENSFVVLAYFENKIIFVNRKGTKLFFYENDTLLFTKDIPLYSTKRDLLNLDRDYQTFRLITQYEQQLICNVNNDRVQSIDINTGELLWEITEYANETSSEKIEVYGIYSATVKDDIIYVLNGQLYIEINLTKGEGIVKKDFRLIEEYKKLEFSLFTMYENKLYFFVNYTDGPLVGNNEVGVFNIDTNEIEEIVKMKIPRDSSLGGSIFADEKYVYIGDYKGNVYVLER